MIYSPSSCIAVSGGYEVTHSLIKSVEPFAYLTFSPAQSKVCCGADVTHAAPLKKERNQWDNNKTPSSPLLLCVVRTIWH